ncbi:CCAAT/enhancer binding protein (C/EBP) 1 isoform X1 [Danio rerio]|uniref:CCAAT/enhancer binding protein (C/EBP) 1 n=2 Tax=Danio rerio TaxID=7955 RepID=Q90ZW4_DANRE|nr:CCAAT/enhancer binding protein (C/EBP) 1 [Danio rerio]AAK48989.1 myeloid-restricted CCAAT/enhancer-binding protein 1 [Danio rerio]|eukprot:NP_571912.1 CCAAT/enhancer binding protein (C/EBP) 1 [Danio rerio]
MSVSDNIFSVHEASSDSSAQTPMDSALYTQTISFTKSPEVMMGYLPYSSCLNNPNTNTERSVQQSSAHTQDFAQFLEPPPASALRLCAQKRGVSKDSAEYRQRRERNNIAVRKSRDKARRRIQMTQQRALQLQDENHRLQVHIQRLLHEVEALRHYLSQRHLQDTSEEH